MSAQVFTVVVLEGPADSPAMRESHRKFFGTREAACAYARARVTLAGGAPVAMVWEASPTDPLRTLVKEYNSVLRRRFLESLAEVSK